MAFPTEDVVLVCGRVGDPYSTHTPAFTESTCCDCGVAVMASPVSWHAHTQEGTPIVCVECYARHRDAGNPVILLRQSPSPEEEPV